MVNDMKLRSALALILLGAWPNALAFAADTEDDANPANPFATTISDGESLSSSTAQPAENPFARAFEPVANPFARGFETTASPFAQVSEPTSGEERQPRYGFSGSLGWGGMAGNFGKLLRYPISGDFNFFLARSKWRYGFGLNFTSMKIITRASAEEMVSAVSAVCQP